MNIHFWFSFFHPPSHFSLLRICCLLLFLNASIPPFLLWLHIHCVWVTKSVHVCVCMWVSACVRVNGLCSLLLPPCWVFPSPWLLLPLSHSKLQGVGSSPLSGSFTFSALPLPSSYLSLIMFFPLLILLSLQILTFSFVHNTRRVSDTFCVSMCLPHAQRAAELLLLAHSSRDHTCTNTLQGRGGVRTDQ